MLLNGDCPREPEKEEGPAEPPRENGLDETEPGEETTGQGSHCHSGHRLFSEDPGSWDRALLLQVR